ncbi:MAG: PLD nuclease N-terminal domain-containing protein [Ruminococcus sp.]|nr:PLD nuclease N-terminal domain-containing protein [Ruminococcus sp.]
MKTEYLPFIIPLAIAQFALMGYALYNVLTHKKYKFGNRIIWIVIVVCFGFIGPAAYFALGKDDE